MYKKVIDNYGQAHFMSALGLCLETLKAIVQLQELSINLCSTCQ